MQKPLIRYVDRAGNVLAEVPAPPHVVVFNTMVRTVTSPEDFTLDMEVVGVRLVPGEARHARTGHARYRSQKKRTSPGQLPAGMAFLPHVAN